MVEFRAPGGASGETDTTETDTTEEDTTQETTQDRFAPEPEPGGIDTTEPEDTTDTTEDQQTDDTVGGETATPKLGGGGGAPGGEVGEEEPTETEPSEPTEPTDADTQTEDTAVGGEIAEEPPGQPVQVGAGSDVRGSLTEEQFGEIQEAFPDYQVQQEDIRFVDGEYQFTQEAQRKISQRRRAGQFTSAGAMAPILDIDIGSVERPPQPLEPTEELEEATRRLAERTQRVDRGGGVTERQADIRDELVSQLEAETGADLDADEDIQLETTTEDGQLVYRGVLTESGERAVRVAREEEQGTLPFFEATTEGGVLTEEQEATLSEYSSLYQTEFAEPVSEFVGEIASPFDATTEEGQEIQAAEQAKAESITRGVLGFGNVPELVKTGETATELTGATIDYLLDADFEEVQQLAGATAAVSGVTATEIADAFEEDPTRTSGQLLGGTAAGALAGGLAPVRLSRVDLPDVDGGTQTLRGLQVGYPGGRRRVLRPGATELETATPTLLRTRTRTLAGSRGFRPSIGTPTAAASRVDFEDLGTRADEAFEPTGQFETQIFRETFEGEGAVGTARRIEAVKNLIRESARSRSRAELELTSTEDIVRRVENVPEGDAARVASAIEETDAAIFGSAATEAQVPGFRRGILEQPAPKDIDVVVPDEAAKQRLQSVESDIGEDIFDIKTTEEVPGRARGGEPIKFGQVSQRMLETEEGVPVNPVSEELLRKAGASGFFRGTGAPEVGEFDVGPQPKRPGRLSTREKDVLDAFAIGQELLGPEARSVRRFGQAFEDVEGLDAPPRRTFRERIGFDEFLASERARVGAGGIGRRTDIDVDETRPRRLRETDTDSPSPARRADVESPTPIPITSPTFGSVFAGTTMATAETSPGEPTDIGAGGFGYSPTATLDSPIQQPTYDSPAFGSPGQAPTFDVPDTGSPINIPNIPSPSPGTPGTPTSITSPPGDTLEIPQPIPDQRPRRDGDERKQDEEKELFGFLGAKERETIGFLDPLTGEEI